ncbi:MAG: cysteine desulfurase-like protein [Propionicimonas sp.]|nr:cysteine desulfurase-like protein [Propionicimonas sp.]
MSYDVALLRSAFPSLLSGTAHFDSPSGTQTPRAVGEAIARTITGPLSYRGALGRSEANAETTVLRFRKACGALLNADPTGIVFGRSATQLIYDFSRHLSLAWGPGDEIILTRLEHDANLRPWVQAAKRTGAQVKWVDFDPETAELDADRAVELIGDRTRLVALTAASNLLGTMPPVARLARAAHRAGALVFVDGVHYTAHNLVDIHALGADFFVCSPYKFLGPHCAVLAADPATLQGIHPDKLLPSPDDVPERFEYGTLPYEILAGVTAAIDFLAGIAPGEGSTRREKLEQSWAAIDAHELRLRERIESELAQLPGVVVHSRAEHRTPTLLVTIDGRSTREAYAFLARRNVLVPAGSFYAVEAFERLGLADTHGLRIGLAPYTDDQDVQRLIEGLGSFLTLG